MALGMSRAVFSFVIEQMSFSRTVSFKQTNKCTPLLTHTHTHPILPVRMHRSAAIPAFPSGRCCYRNRSSSQRGRVVPAGGCPAEEHRSSLQHGWVMKSDHDGKWEKKTAQELHHVAQKQQQQIGHKTVHFSKFESSSHAVWFSRKHLQQWLYS